MRKIWGKSFCLGRKSLGTDTETWSWFRLMIPKPGFGRTLCTISLDRTVCVQFFVKINIIKFVNSEKSYTVDSTTLARIENKKVIIVVANTTPLLTFSIMYLIFSLLSFFIQNLLLRKWMWSKPNEKINYWKFSLW